MLKKVNKYGKSVMKRTNLIFRAVLFCVVLSVASPLFAKLQSDDFNGSKLSSIWKIDNPKKAKWEVNGGKLNVVGGLNANVWGNADATFYYQETTQKAFDVETTVVVDYAKGSTVAGILILSETTKDSKGRKPEWITLKLWGRGGGDNNAVLQYQRRENDNLKGLVGTQPDYKPPAGIIPISLRIKRDGNTYEAWFKPNAIGDWVSVSKVNYVLNAPLKVGIYAGIAESAAADGRKITAEFDYFHEASSKSTPVNPKNRLAIKWGEIKNK